mmetsp:Transcript_27114/g.84294  ORF Transcript_27114/g.84294 Transcript_27114/m.84294 type:complete len:430 (-) Transcript_27114:44-1333(-)
MRSVYKARARAAQTEREAVEEMAPAAADAAAAAQDADETPAAALVTATKLLRTGAPDDGRRAEALLLGIVDSCGPAKLGEVYYALAYRAENGGDKATAKGWLQRAADAGDDRAIGLLKVRKAGARKRRILDCVLVACLVLGYFAVLTLHDLLESIAYKEKRDKEISGSDERTVPAFAWKRNAYARGERAALLRRGEILLQATGDVNPLSGESFGGTRGVVAHFTRDALDDPWAFGHPAYAWLRDDFLAPLLDDRCDAFVFNVLVVPPGRDANRTEGVGQHVDQTLIQPTTIREQTAFSVSVGYLQVPKAIDGGELIVASYQHPPNAGDVLVFRGDQSHRVMAFCVNTTGDCARDADPLTHRISFVLEQYRIPPEKIARTPKFVMAPSQAEQSTLPVIYSIRGLGPPMADLYLYLRRRLTSPKHAAAAGP